MPETNINTVVIEEASAAEESVTEEQTVETEENNIETDTVNETDRLKGEIDRLTELLRQKEQEQEKILNELSEFSRLFPDISVKSVPRSVWEGVERGLPLSAAYALYEREESLMKQRAERINQRNAALSAGKAGDGHTGDYFSPEEVRTMTPKQVHENYSKIRKSMKYWR